jgi:hypothetical protein
VTERRVDPPQQIRNIFGGWNLLHGREVGGRAALTSLACSKGGQMRGVSIQTQSQQRVCIRSVTTRAQPDRPRVSHPAAINAINDVECEKGGVAKDGDRVRHQRPSKTRYPGITGGGGRRDEGAYRPLTQAQPDPCSTAAA